MSIRPACLYSSLVYVISLFRQKIQPQKSGGPAQWVMGHPACAAGSPARPSPDSQLDLTIGWLRPLLKAVVSPRPSYERARCPPACSSWRRSSAGRCRSPSATGVPHGRSAAGLRAHARTMAGGGRARAGPRLRPDRSRPGRRLDRRGKPAARDCRAARPAFPRSCTARRAGHPARQRPAPALLSHRRRRARRTGWLL